MFGKAGIAEGMCVLDIACGAGSTALPAAKRVGPNGSVIASDISEEMLNFLRQNADAACLTNIETLRCAAEDIEHTDHMFDAAICQTGLMLFKSPQNALEGIRTRLRPGGKISVIVFAAPQNNPFAAQPMGIALKHAGKQPPDPGAPGLFALSREDVLQCLFEAAGYNEVEIVRSKVTLQLPSVDDAVAMMQQAFGAYRAVLSDLDQEARDAAWEEIRSCLAQFETPNGLETGLTFHIASARKL
nr:class I SAM-dependent methyltransferase [Aliiroseovarius sp. PrR006]